jgi:hypothetical protein
LAPTQAPKPNVLLKILKIAGGVAVAGACGYLGFIWVHGIQQKANASRQADESKNSGESQVGHIANLNAVLDATEPGHSLAEMPRNRRRAATAPTPDDSDTAMGTAAADKAVPTVAPVWTLDLAAAKIPETHANGTISGSNFLVEAATVIPSGGATVLRLSQGSPMSPEREVLIYLHLKPGEKLGGQTYAISQDMKASVPSVTKRWKSDPRFAPATKSFTSGYAMKLELSAPTNGAVPGKIFLALPDPEQSVVAGLFKIVIPTADPGYQPTAAPAPIPTAGNAAAADAYRKRYGLGK